MEQNTKQPQALNDELLDTITGGASEANQDQQLSKICFDCRHSFYAPAGSACPACGSKNLYVQNGVVMHMIRPDAKRS